MQAKKPMQMLRCKCGAVDFHYEYERNYYVCRACGRKVAGCTRKRKS